MKIRGPIFALVIIAALLAACGEDATPIATPGLALPTAQELKRAGQELFDTFSASIQTRDAAALHGVFVADLRERCTVEQMQESLAGGKYPFLRPVPCTGLSCLGSTAWAGCYQLWASVPSLPPEDRTETKSF